MYARGTKSHESNLWTKSFKESSSIYEANGPNRVGFMVPSPLSLRKTTQGDRAVKGTVESSRYSALISKLRCVWSAPSHPGRKWRRSFQLRRQHPRWCRWRGRLDCHYRHDPRWLRRAPGCPQHSRGRPWRWRRTRCFSWRSQRVS